MKLNKKKVRTLVIVVVLLVVLFVVSPNFRASVFDYLGIEMPEKIEQATPPAPVPEGQAEVHIIDVGQGDSTLVKAGGFNLLIDAGTGKYEEKLVAYLKDVGVEKIDIMLLTHPHEDHIGGADLVIDKFEVGEIIMPDATTDTKAFERVLDGAESKNIPISTVFRGDSFTEGGFVFDILSPDDKNYKDLNNTSIVMKLTYGDVSMMFTGDAEALVESEILDAYPESNLKCVFLKSGHHGSSSSSTKDFVSAVEPEYVSISCGVDNDYGHPHAETLALYEKLGLDVKRTDILGSFVYITDGKSFEPKEK